MVALADILTKAAGGLRDAISALGQQAITVTCDVADPDSMKYALDTVLERFGRLDIVFALQCIFWSGIQETQSRWTPHTDRIAAELQSVAILANGAIIFLSQ